MEHKKKFGLLHIANPYFLYFFLGILTLISVLPFYTMLINATRDTNAIAQSVALLPGDSLTSNYHNAMEKINVWQGLWNSVQITFPAVFLSAYFGTMVAFGLTIFGDFKGRDFIFSLVIVTLLIPPQLGIIGYYNMVAEAGFLDNYLPIILPAIGNAATIFFLKQYMEISVHGELIESARMDGASYLQIFHKIVIPLCSPSIATMSIFNFVFNWNNYITPLVLISDEDKYTLPLVVGAVKTTTFGTDYGSIYLVVAISVVPILIAFVFLAKYIVGGVNAGAVKG